MPIQRELARILASCVLGFSTVSLADDWPRWRGPEGSGVSPEHAWSAEGKADSLWEMNVGLGYSSFVIREGRVITAGFDVDKELDTIYCLNASSGEKIWTHSFPSKRWDKYHIGGTQSTPTIDGDHVYALNREGRFMCLKFADGSVVWEKQLTDEFDLDYPEWMFSASPLIRGDLVIVNVGRTIAFDKADGALRWQTEKSGDAYSTPQPMTFKGRACLAVFNSDGLFIFDEKDGSTIASHEWKTQYDINAATPIVIGDRIFISSGQNRGCAMLRLTDDGLEVVWENKQLSTKMTGCVLWDDHLYGFDDAILKCIDLDGNEKWTKRGLGMGALMIAGGRLIVTSSKGELIIADASPGGMAELSRQRVLEGGVYWSSPVIANGLIYCRNSEGDIVCRDHRTAGS